jgi:hypothetical protein
MFADQEWAPGHKKGVKIRSLVAIPAHEWHVWDSKKSVKKETEFYKAGHLNISA